MIFSIQYVMLDKTNRLLEGKVRNCEHATKSIIGDILKETVRKCEHVTSECWKLFPLHPLPISAFPMLRSKGSTTNTKWLEGYFDILYCLAFLHQVWVLDKLNNNNIQSEDWTECDEHKSVRIQFISICVKSQWHCVSTWKANSNSFLFNLLFLQI